MFSLAEHAILVRDYKGAQMFEMTLTFNDKGECKLYVNEEERELWQVRRMALEDLLFRGYWSWDFSIRVAIITFPE